MEEAARYAFFAERWHWTPAQVDELPSHLELRLPAVATIIDEIQEDKTPKVPEH